MSLSSYEPWARREDLEILIPPFVFSPIFKPPGMKSQPNWTIYSRFIKPLLSNLYAHSPSSLTWVNWLAKIKQLILTKKYEGTRLDIFCKAKFILQ